MKRHKIAIIYIILYLLLGINPIFSRKLRPCVNDNGGGIRFDSGTILSASIGQGVIGIRSNGEILQAGYITMDTLDLEFSEERKTPEEIIIGEFYPNPFNAESVIGIRITRISLVNLSIFDVSGRIVHQWARELSPGDYKISFSPGDKLPSGIYLYNFGNSKKQKYGKVVYLK